MAIQLLGLYFLLWECFIVETKVKEFGPIMPSSISFSSLFPRIPPMKMSKDKIKVIATNLTGHPSWQLLPKNCGVSSYPSDRIIGGDDAFLGEYPWMVLVGVDISNKQLLVCGGSLISEWYTITAAHCIEPCDLAGRPIARLGENYVDDDIDCKNGVCAPKPIDIDIDFFIMPKEYDDAGHHHDIGLVKLKTRAKFNDFIKPICLPTAAMIQHASETLNTRDTVEVAGWGLTNSMNEEKPSALQTVALPVVSMSSCKTVFGDLVLDQSQLCVGDGYMRDSCAGDSGGPLMKSMNSDEGPPRHHLFGIVSFGRTKCGTESAVYVNVMHYMDWILDNIDPTKPRPPKS